MYFGTLPEEFIFLSIDEDSGVFDMSDLFLSIGLAGASLLSLTIFGRLSMRGKQVIIIDNTPMEKNRTLDLIFTYMKETDDPKSIYYWIRNIRSEFPDLIELYTKEMIEAGKLESYLERKFFIFKRTKYRIKNTNVNKIIKQRLHEAVVVNKEADPRTVAFLSLLYATNSAKELLDEEEIEVYMEQIENFEEEIGMAVEESINTIMDALMRSLIVNSQYPYL